MKAVCSVEKNGIYFSMLLLILNVNCKTQTLTDFENQKNKVWIYIDRGCFRIMFDFTFLNLQFALYPFTQKQKEAGLEIPQW